MNILILSAGTRCQLVTYFKQPENGYHKVVTTDCSKYAPALYLADAFYIVPRMNEPNYLQVIEGICKKEEIDILLPLQEDELELISESRELFEGEGIFAAVSKESALKMCRDKYALSAYLECHGINCVKTYDFKEDKSSIKSLEFPVFVKPRCGCGSMNSMQIKTFALLEEFVKESSEPIIVQPFMEAEEYRVDLYIDFISNKVTSIFAKKKLRMRAGETEKSISIIDEALFDLVKDTVQLLGLSGPVDIDVFKYAGEYYILEINPRFGGGYSHAYECGISFPAMLCRNAKKQENDIHIGNYTEGKVCLKYTGVMIKNEKDMLSGRCE